MQLAVRVPHCKLTPNWYNCDLWAVDLANRILLIRIKWVRRSFISKLRLVKLGSSRSR